MNQCAGAIGKPVSEAIAMELAMLRDGRKDDPVPARSLRMAIRKQMEKAAQGDLRALEYLSDRIEGKPKVTVAGDNEAPIAFQIEHQHTARQFIMSELQRIADRTGVIEAIAKPDSDE